ncbi:glycosyl transferase family 9 [Bacteroides coprosuis DSM 18011]|uniref:Glycosyl transferase family 9 n=1 Tax=Bacteroides coprosuis DSM 18011 TaxID=679937 RepID=F3ZQF0_9BACE|nr:MULTISPECIES: glycosyltransferase family 9 protein [Bacteroides]EGJ70528.1 glycosyl transferase family 9 [Bacteroides coprosuis DSM 18011]HJD92658.1 glycosyltransferase family 9 protein [Bacteroides coprosuis]
MARILIIRFSAIGDVAMTAPIVHSLALQYPELEITVLSRNFLQPIFKEMPSNVKFLGADLKGEHKGIAGLNKLFKELKKYKFDYVADFHNVLRSKYLGLRFKLEGVPVATVFKGRAGKRKLVRRNNKVFVRQKSLFQRYTDVLEYLGFPISANFDSIFGEGKGDFSKIKEVVGDKNQKWLGIAPFAQHKGKIYPIEKMEKVLAHFANEKRVKIFLFGGGAKEKAVFDEWVKKYPSVMSMIGKFDMEHELILMSYLDLMLSMDSSNMHLASLVNVPVLSIWGATHPYAGFLGWKQLPTNTIQIEDLPCRPCSVYGQKECYRKDYACLNRIEPQVIIDRIERDFSL